jgi:hypothetical protein
LGTELGLGSRTGKPTDLTDNKLKNIFVSRMNNYNNPHTQEIRQGRGEQDNQNVS